MFMANAYQHFYEGFEVSSAAFRISPVMTVEFPTDYMYTLVTVNGCV